MLISNTDLEKKLKIYEELLLKWSSSLNLVAKSTLQGIRTRHFADSLQLVPFLSAEDRILDLGSGAGFPGMVLAMCGYNVTLLDSDQKKCVFLENVSRETETKALIVCSRIESYMPDEKFDIISARGVASLSKLINLSKGFIKKEHTKGLFLKGENVDLELSNLPENRLYKLPSQINPGSYIIQYQF
jgi:16S rRNA (guanine527-N7)-methyltransferase